MADLADVMDWVEGTARGAVFPSGLQQPSVTGKDVVVAQGWPPSADLDREISLGNTVLSIYPQPSSTSPEGTPLNSYYTVAGPAPGLALTAADPIVTVGGVANAGDVAVLLLDGLPYPYTAQAGDTSAAVLAAWLALVVGKYPDAVVQGSTITVASARTVRGAVSSYATLGRKLHRQRVLLQIDVWAASPSDRTTVARAVDVALKAQVRSQLPDTTSVLIAYQGTNWSDKEENAGLFRRTLLFNATYETIETISAQTVVASVLSTAPLSSGGSDG